MKDGILDLNICKDQTCVVRSGTKRARVPSCRIRVGVSVFLYSTLHYYINYRDSISWHGR